MARTLVLKPSAKINLTLHVGPLRADGYHDVSTLLQSIALHDTLTLSDRRGPFRLTCRTPGVPSDRSNLVWRAAELLWEAMGRPGEPRDAHIKLEKKIPAQAGLGGGSADAAAALVGLNSLWEAKQSRRDLLRLAAGLGSDVPFFLQGGTALGIGRGHDVYPVDDVMRFGVIVIKPSFGVAAADAYGWLDQDREAQTPPAESALTSGAGVDAGDGIDVGWPSRGVRLVNDLEASVGRRHPGVLEMIDACAARGAVGARMSGSGSAVFGLFPERVAARAARELKRPDWLVLLTRTQTRREAARRIAL